MYLDFEIERKIVSQQNEFDFLDPFSKNITQIYFRYFN